MQLSKKHLFFFFIPLLFWAASKPSFFSYKKFNPDAGIVIPINKKGSITASSNQSAVQKTQDGDLSTAWQSGAPLPTGFITNSDQNILLHQKPHANINSSWTNAVSFTDGNLNNVGNVSTNLGKAMVEFALKSKNLFSVSLKGQTDSPIHLSAKLNTGEIKEIGVYSKKDNFQLIRFEKSINNIDKLRLTCDKKFALFEIAALSEAPKEFIVFHFPKPERIGSIKGKLWAGSKVASSSNVYASQDGNTWNYLTSFSPEIKNEFLLGIPEKPVSHLKIEHTLIPNDWNKVYFWEIKLYDRHAHYGEKPTANQSAVSIKDMLGINGYWSWGTDQYSHLLGENEGPRKFKHLISHARNYHDMTWDVLDPGQPIDFSKMSEHGTPAKDWVNWDLEYTDWKKTGFDIQASLQFYRFKPEDWQTPEKSAFNYAKAFTHHFGNKSGNGLICTIEAGNEPWEYPANIYQKILKGIVTGAKSTDPGMEVFPCALQAADPEMEKTHIFKNYIGARITAEMAGQLDGVNAHIYSYVTDKNGHRMAVHPEHPLSTFWEINNMIRWRDHNMPGKKIYLSEWGWDHSGGGEDCTHDVCVSEVAGAAYAVRALLIAARLGIERASWYFHNNVKGPSSLYTRSGLISSSLAGFRSKYSYWALHSLNYIMGDAYFLKIIKEDESGWVYLFGDKLGKPTHIVGWLPVDGNSSKVSYVSIDPDYDINLAMLLSGTTSNLIQTDLPVKKENSQMLKLLAQPTVFQLNN